MKKIFALLLMFLLSKLAIGQKTHFHPIYDNLYMTSLAVATSLRDAVLAFDESLVLVETEKEFPLCTISNFAKSDTILELVRVDSCNRCGEHDKYMININTDISIENIWVIINNAKKKIDKKHYKQIMFFNETLDGFWSIAEKRLRQPNITDDTALKCKKLIEKAWVLETETGKLSTWRFESYSKHYITDALYAEIKRQLKHPLYPKQYGKDYMEDNKDKWDPALIDTSMLNRDYLKLWRNKTINEQEFSRNWSIDTAFKRYNEIAMAQGITPQQALYNDVLHKFWMQGYKDFGPMIDFAISKNDLQLLPALKAFYKKNPDFKFTEQQKAYFEKNR